jgi:hypothetical protein
MCNLIDCFAHLVSAVVGCIMKVRHLEIYLRGKTISLGN